MAKLAKLNESQKQKLSSLVLAMETVTTMTKGCFKMTFRCTKKEAQLNHIKTLKHFIDNN